MVIIGGMRLNDAVTIYAAQPIARRGSQEKARIVSRIAARLGHRTLSSLDERALLSYATSGDVAPSTAHNMLAILSGMYDALDAGGVDIPHRDAPRRAARHLRTLGHVDRSPRVPPRVSEAQLSEIIRAWTGPLPHWPVHFLVDTAWRSGELCRLQWRDVDMRTGVATIRARKAPRGQSRNDQRVPLLGRARSILAMVANTTAPQPLPQRQQSLSRAFRRAATRAGLEELHLHDLRHEAISRLIDRGWTIPEVAAVSGHRSWQTLKRYTHPNPEILLEKDRCEILPPSSPSASSSRCSIRGHGSLPC